jgi:hypothetical protein
MIFISFLYIYIKFPALTVPPLSHRTSRQFIISHYTLLIPWILLYVNLTYIGSLNVPVLHVPNLVCLFHCLGRIRFPHDAASCTRQTESTGKFRLDFTASQYESCIPHRRNCDKLVLWREISSHLPITKKLITGEEGFYWLLTQNRVLFDLSLYLYMLWFYRSYSLHSLPELTL